MSAPSGSDSRPARKRQRRSARADQPAIPPPCVHPFNNLKGDIKPVDASTIDALELRDLLSQANRVCVDRLDFVDVSDAVIDKLFVRAYHGKSPVLPPLSRRRTAQQIREFFRLSGSARKDIVERESGAVVDRDFADSAVRWDGENSNWSDLCAASSDSSASGDELDDPVPPSRCGGITLQFIRESRIGEERKKELELGFKHTVREGLSLRPRVSHPNDDRWNFRPPVVGAIEDGNDGRIKWLVKESCHGESDQYERMLICAVACSGGELSEKERLCTDCQKHKKRLMERLDSQISLRAKPIHPNTRTSILARTWSLQKQQTDYHRRQSHNKTLKIIRRDKIIAELEKAAVEIDRNKQSDLLFCDDVETAAFHLDCVLDDTLDLLRDGGTLPPRERSDETLINVHKIATDDTLQ